ncbi:MAG: GNAT family N-acetyltransferase [Polyangiaceae bacterium]
MSGLRTPTIERLGSDLLTMARCIVLDVDAFPYPSIPFDLGRRHPSVRVWVARDAQGGVIGFLAALVRRELEIVGLAVERTERRRGVGRALLDEAMTAAEGLPVVLHVSTSNGAAIGLYERAGFVAERRLVRFYSRGVYPDRGDALRMVWSGPWRAGGNPA